MSSDSNPVDYPYPPLSIPAPPQYITPVLWVLHYLTDVLYSTSELNTERYMATMANDNDTNRLLNEAAEKIRREGFIAGWQAAIAAVAEAATKLAPEAQEGFDIADIMAAPSSISRPGEPTPGSTPSYVLQAVKKRHGMTGAEVVSVVQDSGHKVSDASIRTALARLNKKHIVVRHRKWFPI